MEPVFLDTAYVFALLNTRDQWHVRAKQWEQLLARERRPLVTTEYVLVEIADGLANLRFRSHALQAIAVLTTSPLTTIVSGSSDLLTQAIAMYSNRPDKEWGLTDCASFIVMQQRTIHQALTADQHFLQAGFRTLMLEEPN